MWPVHPHHSVGVSKGGGAPFGKRAGKQRATFGCDLVTSLMSPLFAFLPPSFLTVPASSPVKRARARQATRVESGGRTPVAAEGWQVAPTAEAEAEVVEDSRTCQAVRKVAMGPMLPTYAATRICSASCWT